MSTFRQKSYRDRAFKRLKQRPGGNNIMSTLRASCRTGSGSIAAVEAVEVAPVSIIIVTERVKRAVRKHAREVRDYRRSTEQRLPKLQSEDRDERLWDHIFD